MSFRDDGKSSSVAVASAYQLVVRHLAKERPTLNGLSAQFFPDQGPRPGSLIEISGGPNSGKSLLLQELMAHCLPPTSFGGRQCDVVFIDLEHKFDTRRFVDQTVRRVLSDSCDPCPKTELTSAALQCAKSMTILRCFSADELYLALDVVEDMLWKNGKIALLAVDVLDAFYWADTHQHLIRKSTHYAKATARLRQVCEEHNICCAYTVDASCSEAKTKSADAASLPPQKCVGQENPTADYIFKLQLWPDALRTLNGRLITIDAKGIRFADAAQQHL